jgi:hypothetical protein
MLLWKMNGDNWLCVISALEEQCSDEFLNHGTAVVADNKKNPYNGAPRLIGRGNRAWNWMRDLS